MLELTLLVDVVMQSTAEKGNLVAKSTGKPEAGAGCKTGAASDLDWGLIAS